MKLFYIYIWDKVNGIHEELVTTAECYFDAMRKGRAYGDTIYGEGRYDIKGVCSELKVL